MIRGHVIELSPNDNQATYFARACGVARLAYNWALSQWQSQYQEDKAYRDRCKALGVDIDKDKLNTPSQGKLRRKLNAIKRDQYPFMLEVTKCAPQLASILYSNLKEYLPDLAIVEGSALPLTLGFDGIKL